MNVASAAPLFAIWIGCCHRRWALPETQQNGEVQLVAWRGVQMLLWGIVLGIGLATVVWLRGDRALFQVLPFFHHKLFWAVWELAFYFPCVALLVKLHAKSFRGAGVLRLSFAFLASSNLLYHFPTLFSVMSHVAARPNSLQEPVGPSEFRTLMMQGHVASMSVHFAFASLTVMAVEVLCRFTRESSDASINADHGAKMARRAAGVALAATALQVPVGVWLMFRMDPSAQQQLMGGNLLSTTLMGMSVLATFGLLHLLAASVFGKPIAAFAHRSRIVLALIIAMMSGVLHRL